MTDRQKQLIAGYLPNPRDPELKMGEYYVLDMRDRPTKVRLVNIAPHGDDTVYQVVTPAMRTVHGPYEVSGMSELFGGGWYYKGSLYDNKQDCKDSVHSWCHYWEDLRELQRKEALE